MTAFSDHVVFVDESGDHSLTSIDPQFPVFALSFCVVSKRDYVSAIVPAVQSLKFQYWGHDAVILHEHEIRKTAGDFAFLRTDPNLREAFLRDLHAAMVAAPFTVIASAIDKTRLRARYSDPWNPYEIALHFCLERLLGLLKSRGEAGRHVHVIFECRGKVEDAALELAFRRIIDGAGRLGPISGISDISFEPKFARKSVNSTGLQLADLTARPIALQILRPDQPNRAWDVIRTKLGAIKQFP